MIAMIIRVVLLIFRVSSCQSEIFFRIPGYFKLIPGSIAQAAPGRPGRASDWQRDAAACRSHKLEALKAQAQARAGACQPGGRAVPVTVGARLTAGATKP